MEVQDLEAEKSVHIVNQNRLRGTELYKFMSWKFCKVKMK